MRSRILPVAAVSAAALALAVAYAPGAGAASHGIGNASTSHAGTTVHYAKKGCFSQGTTLTGSAVSSQNFESTFDAYDDYATNTLGKVKCKVKNFSVSGQYNGAGGVTTGNVLFFKVKKGMPASSPFSETDNVSVTDDGTGNFTGSLSKAVKLKGNVSFTFQANLDFSSGGQWYWNVSSDGNGGGMWENPGGGFGVCQTWGTLVTCNGAPDNSLSFSLS